ncbi:MAG: AAA family ATPase, partial [Chloroflexota bacterium]|nr:AAA family ATPase [Chloroflexota bacterium]
MESPVTIDPTQRLAPEIFAERAQAIEREVGRVIVGQRELVRQTLTGLLANSHVLLEGVPGLGKT